MPLKIIDHGTPEYTEMVDMRRQILRKPLGLDFTEDELNNEHDNLHIAIYEDDVMLGCCMLVKTDDEKVQLRQMAVKTGLQGKGIGRSLMQFAENLARDRGFRKVIMHARKAVAGFYQKLGYKIVGEEFTEITIPHFIMEKEL